MLRVNYGRCLDKDALKPRLKGSRLTNHPIQIGIVITLILTVSYNVPDIPEKTNFQSEYSEIEI